jgi:glycosyltransferase involved in cell wall biosynthesis/tetratricopeptide (TPR) repeat protein
MSVSQQHAQAIAHFEAGRYVEAIRLLEALLIETPTSDLWNDWATAQLASGNSVKACDGFAKALTADPVNHTAAVNYGVLLCTAGRVHEGKPLLERALGHANGVERAQLEEFMAKLPTEPVPQRGHDARNDPAFPPTPDNAPSSLNVLVIHEILPHADRHGADVQWMQMLTELRAQGHRVTHIARSSVNSERYAPEVERLGIRVLAPDAERMRFAGYDFAATWRFDKLLRREHFDLAILAHWFWNGISIPEHYVNEIRALSPRTFVAVLTDDQHALRELQMARLTRRWNDFERCEDYGQREMEVYKRSDCVLTISDDDARAFLAKCPELRTARMPMIAEIPPDGPGFDERSGLVFLANFDNLANSDATTWFVREIWPLVRRALPDANLALVGNNLPNDPQFHGAGILRVGFVADLVPEFAKYRVAVSPVRFGTGIKTKNLLAMANSVPLVTTRVGADGMNLIDGESALIADTPEDFAKAVLRAYNDRELWQKLSKQGRSHIAVEFSADRMARAVSELCEMARTISPLAGERGSTWSFTDVEAYAPECLTGIPPMQRPTLRITAYVELAAKLLSDGNAEEALAQLRHFFGLLRGPVKATSLTIRSMELAAECYRKLGNAAKAKEYDDKVAQSCALDQHAEKNGTGKRAKTAPLRARANELDVSVIVPTFNRKPTLALCLDALAQQTFSAGRFEVIVVDDGSSDNTPSFCREYDSPFSLVYLRQTNAGAGAARRRGVQHARGKLLLLINDDTIAAPDLLDVHYECHQRHAGERQAVLGDFQFPETGMDRALTRFLMESPFLFPQVNLQPGIHWDYTKFVTCNASITRDAVAGVGSFDPDFRVAEDSELGLRLSRRGYFVRYLPEARATHEHLPFGVPDLVRRAKAYGAIQLPFLRKHPCLLGDGSTQYGWLDQKFVDEWRERLDRQRAEILDAESAIAKYDDVPFAEFSKIASEGRALAGEVMRMFRRVVPEVYWHHFYGSLVETIEKEARVPAHVRQQRSAVQRDVYL